MAYREQQTQDYINHMVDMKMIHNKPHTEILAYVTKDLGYSTTRAYQLWNEAKKYIEEVTREMRLDAHQEAILRLEKQYQIAEKECNRRMMLDIQKELNKLNGLYKQDQVTTNIVFKAKWGN
jgi:hypothetical protein